MICLAVCLGQPQEHAAGETQGPSTDPENWPSLLFFLICEPRELSALARFVQRQRLRRGTIEIMR